MTFKKVFEDMCGNYTKKPAKFITVSGETFKKISARRMMLNCLESKHQVVLSGYTDYGNAKVCDFWSQVRMASGTCHENNFVIVFVNGDK